MSFARPALSNTEYDLAASIIVFKLCYRHVPLVAKWPSASGTLGRISIFEREQEF